jgi:hypothetical protein
LPSAVARLLIAEHDGIPDDAAMAKQLGWLADD